MKLSLKKILEAGGIHGRHTNVEQSGRKLKYTKNPEEFPEVFSGPCEASIKNNHGHILEVSMMDVHDQKEREYNIKGRSEHNHTVILKPDDFRKLSEGGKVKKLSSQDTGHNHVVIIKCE